MSKHHHVVRYDAGGCWLLVVKRPWRTFRKSFSYRRYGGKAGALAEAMAYRDALLAAIPKWSMHRQRSARNTTGIIGVSFSERQQSGRIYRLWIAHWKEGDRHRTRAFSVGRYGYRQAKALAVALRREKEAAAIACEAPPLVRERLPHPAPEPKSNTGVLGVCRRIRRGVAVYIAYWKENGVTLQRSFSASRHGGSGALALAIKVRRAHEDPRTRLAKRKWGR